MNKEQIKNLITKIKGYYPKFNLNSLSMNEWYKELAKYDEYDVLNSLENYVNRGSDFYPKLNQLTYHLKTIEEKKQNDLSNMLVDCPLCKKTINYMNFNKHYNKCLLIRSIIISENKAGRHTTYEELESCTYEYLRNMYDIEHKEEIESLKKNIK